MSSTDSTSNRSMKERAEDSGEYDRTMCTMEVHADILAYLHLGKDRALYGLNVPRADMPRLFQETARLFSFPADLWEPFIDCMEGRRIT